VLPYCGVIVGRFSLRGAEAKVGVQHQTSVSNIKHILATCVADDGFVRHGTMLGESCQTSSAVGSIFVASSRTRLAPVARPVPGKMRPTVTITPQAIPKAFSFGVPIRSRSHGSTPSCVTSPPNWCRSARPRSIRMHGGASGHRASVVVQSTDAWFSSLSLPTVWWRHRRTALRWDGYGRTQQVPAKSTA
jgi:hypothetical protein